MPSPTTPSAAKLSSFTGNSLIDPLIYGIQWVSSTISYSFIGVGTSYYYSLNYTDTSYWMEVQGFSSAQRAAAQSALNSWSDVANITFTQSVDNSTTVGAIRLAFSGSHVFGDFAAQAYTPGNTNPSAGDLWLNPEANEVVAGNYSGTFATSTFGSGTYGYNILIHELGHALGLWHPFEASAFKSQILESAYDTRALTVMSYTTDSDNASAIGFTFNPTTPMLLDVAAIQALYGPNLNHNVRDTVYTFDDSKTYFQTIWDAGGTDTIIYTGNKNSTIELRAGYGSTIGNPVYTFDVNGNYLSTVKNIWIAYGVTIEKATGGGGNDILNGNAANNSLNGGAGADTMIGGKGNDTYIVDDAGDVVTETSALATEIDTIKSSISYSLGNYVERLILTGAADIVATGNTLKNTLIGNSGNNRLDGGTGADTMLGGAGNDTYLVDNIADRVYETTTTLSTIDAGGMDSVESGVSWTLGSFVENLTLNGSANLNGTGNGLANILNGNSGNNILNGRAGIDTLTGGDGSDTYVVDNTGDTVTEALGEGTDTVNVKIGKAGGTYELGDNIENGTLLNTVAYSLAGNSLDNVLTGNAAINTLVGGDGNDTLNGGAGIDTLIGGLGEDTYIVGQAGELSKIIENSGAGTDLLKIIYANANTSALTVNLGLANLADVENVTIQGAGLFNVTGNTLGNVLTGNSSINLLQGGDGNDTLDGGLGKDTLWGGAGNDTFNFATALNPTTNVDKIMDFTQGEDVIALDDAIFAALSGGVLDANIRSAAGATTATTFDEHLICNTTTGALYYDVDGSGDVAAKLFCYVNDGVTTTSHPYSLGASDFIFV